MHKTKFWFYTRKGIFQVFLPVSLGLMTYSDYFTQKNNPYFYYYIYFYTSLILFSYAILSYIINYIFSITSSSIILGKDINGLSLNIENYVEIKQIFDLKYSKNIFFYSIDIICWALGINCPIFISNDVLNLINLDNNSSLNQALYNLYHYESKDLYTLNNSHFNKDGEIIFNDNKLHNLKKHIFDLD